MENRMQGQQHNVPKPDAVPFTPEIVKEAIAAANKMSTAVEDFPRNMHNAMCVDTVACGACLVIGLIGGALALLAYQRKG
jgi:hypothetical protein